MAHRSIKGVEETLAMMKRHDNSWANKYVLDVGHLLMKLKEAHTAGEQAGLRRASEIVKERAAFNSRQRDRYRASHEHKFAELKDTRRDEGEIIVKEIEAAILAEAGEK